MVAPLVSVYIATQNRADLLARAITSVLEQDYGQIEIIVVDDGSTDNTPEVLSAFERQCNNLKYYRFEKSKGAPAARNFAISRSSGEFITGLDDDDYFTEERISKFLSFWDDKYSFVCSSLAHFNGIDFTEVSGNIGVVSWDAIRGSNVVGNQVFSRREIFEKSGGFDEAFPAWQDYDLWFRLIKQFGDAYKVADVTYIQDVSSEINRISTSSKPSLGYKQFLAKHSSDLEAHHIALQFLNYCICTGTKPPLKRYISLCHPKTFGRLNSVYFRKYFPTLHRLAHGMASKLRRQQA